MAKLSARKIIFRSIMTSFTSLLQPHTMIFSLGWIASLLIDIRHESTFVQSYSVGVRLSSIDGKFKLAYWDSWTLDARVRHWTPDAGFWTLDSELWVLNSGPWTVDAGCWTLHFGRWAMDTGHCRWLFQNRIRTQFLILPDQIIGKFWGAIL